MGRQIDLNCDMGESFGIYRIGHDEEMMRHITSINVACGFHAGDPHVMRKTVALAGAAGVAVGAHPGYPDRIGFGRRKLSVSPAEAMDYVIYQVGALKAFCAAAGVPLQHVKPHGEFYNMAWTDERLAEAILDGLVAVDPKLMFLALPGSVPFRLAQGRGIRVVGELYADLDYRADGTTIIKRVHGESDPEATIRKVLRMVTEGRVATVDGGEIPVEGTSVCLHGDNPSAPEIARRLRGALEAAGMEVVPMGVHQPAPLAGTRP
jgi:UPF0271 protein